jgi:hypothetical protein
MASGPQNLFENRDLPCRGHPARAWRGHLGLASLRPGRPRYSRTRCPRHVFIIHGLSDREAQALGEAFRHQEDLYLTLRRGIILTSFGAGLCMMAIGLYQTGIIRRLYDLPLPRFKSSRIAAVPPTYRPLGLPIPDSLLGLVSYATTAALAGLGGPDRHQRSPGLVFLMAAKVAFDAVLGGVLFAIQWSWYRMFCMYCVTTSLLGFVAAALALPETRAALRRFRHAR